MITAKALPLLFNIARCKHALEYIKGSLAETHPCYEICSTQPQNSNCFQVPEPWRGDIEHAPLLFVSSNPSINYSDDSPFWRAKDQAIERYFYDGFPNPDFPKIRFRNGGLSQRPVSFWSNIKSMAEKLYGVPKNALLPGKHFAITELVHCKSIKEIGVAKAMPNCTKSHDVLKIAGARVIVGLGAHVRDLWECKFFHHCRLGMKKGMVIVLPHPNARMKRDIPRKILIEAQSVLQTYIKEVL